MSDDIREIHLSGCSFGKVLDQRFSGFSDRLGSKIEDAQSTAQVAIDVTREQKEALAKVKSIAIDAVVCTHAALESARKAEEAFKEIAIEIKRDFKALSTKWDNIWIPLVLGSLASSVTFFGAMSLYLKLTGKW